MIIKNLSISNKRDYKSSSWFGKNTQLNFQFKSDGEIKNLHTNKELREYYFWKTEIDQKRVD